MSNDSLNSNKKTIIFFIGALAQGGAERVISILSRHLAEAGYNVEILLYYDREIFYEIDDRIQITVVERMTGTKKALKNFFWTRHYFKKSNAVIISFLAPFNIFAISAHLGLKTPIVVADRNDPRRVPDNFFIRRIRNICYHFANGVVLQTTRNKEYFSRSIQRKSRVIFNPVDLGPLAGKAINTPKQKKIISVGRLMPQKNQKMLIEAFSIVSERCPKYELYIYGDGSEYEHLMNQANELGIGPKVHFSGCVKNVFEQMLNAELFVLSSNYEGMPNALIEAMCLGLPCISTNVSGVDDIIQNRINGEVVSIGDTRELAKQIIDLLNDTSRMNQYASEAIKLNNILDTKTIMNQWIDYIGEIK